MQRVGWMEKGEQPNKQGKSAAAHTHADRRTIANNTKCGQIGKDARIFSEEQGSTKPKATKLAFERGDSKRRNDLTLSHGFSPSNPTEHLHYKRRQTKTRKPQTRRAGQHRKSRSYCRTERLSYTKPVLGSQLSHKLRVRNAVPAQQGAPDGTLPSCGVRTFPPPCGIRKRPGGASSRKAVADLFGQAMNGKRAAAPAAMGKTLQAFFMSALCAQRVLLAAASALNESFVETRAKPRVSIGDFARCDGRLRALP